MRVSDVSDVLCCAVLCNVADYRCVSGGFGTGRLHDGAEVAGGACEGGWVSAG